MSKIDESIGFFRKMSELQERLRRRYVAVWQNRLGDLALLS